MKKPKFQYVAQIAAGGQILLDPFPTIDTSYVRLYASVHGNDSGTIDFGGAIALPSGYKDTGVGVVEGKYTLGSNDSVCFDLYGISTLNISYDGGGAGFVSIILQGFDE